MKQVRAIIALPFMVTVVIPVVLLRLSRQRKTLTTSEFAAGVGLLIAGLSLLIATLRQFITVGRGTLAPWDPPKHLVVTGVYRRVRNPMISGVAAILMGEALLSGSRALRAWAFLFAAINAVYIPLVEEPKLHQRFGREYAVYARHVPRWLPRLRP